MKKQIIFIYDPKTEKLTQVCDVRSVNPDKVIELTQEAKNNAHEILKAEEDEKEELLKIYKETVHSLQVQISDLRAVVKYLLGYNHFEEPVIKMLLGIKKEEETNE